MPLPGDGRDPRHLAVQLAPRAAAASLLGAGHVHLGHDQQLGPLGQRRAVLRQLVADRPVILDRVGAVERHGLDEVDEQVRPLDVPEELVAQPVAGVGPFDQAGDVGHDEVLILGDDRAQVGVLGGERIIGDLGMGARDPREQRRLAGVGQADQADVGDDLQLQDDPALLARDAPSRPAAVPGWSTT